MFVKPWAPIMYLKVTVHIVQNGFGVFSLEGEGGGGLQVGVGVGWGGKYKGSSPPFCTFKSHMFDKKKRGSIANKW